MSLTELFLERSLKDKSLAQNLPLALRRGETYQRRERIDELLGEHWTGRKAWLRSDGEEGDKKFTYGEVTPMGARQLIEIMELETLDEENEDQEFSVSAAEDPVVFYDLGSGAGKLVVQMFLENVVTSSVGIELSTNRHSLAEEAWGNLQKSSAISRKYATYKVQQQGEHCAEVPRVRFINEDFLDADFTDATHLFVSSLCFPENLTTKITERIVKNHQELGRLKFVAALSDLTLLENDENKEYWKKSYELVHMTWGLSNTRVYKYIG